MTDTSMTTAGSPGATAAAGRWPDWERVSAHLWWSELGCHDGTPYPKGWAHRAIVLATEFEALRAMAGHQPLRVLSAYRTPMHNAKVGGARWSQHLYGRALDLKRPETHDPEDWWQMAMTVARQPGSQIRGLGKYRTFVHLDIRPAARLVTWEAVDAHHER